MTSIPNLNISTTYAADAPSAQNNIRASALDTDHATMEGWANDHVIPALNSVIREDNTLVDGIVRLRNLHSEVLSLVTEAGETGIPAGGDLTGLYPSPELVPSGVAPGAYGSASEVSSLTLDAKGRVTTAANVAIAVPATAISDSTTAGRALLTAPNVGAQRTALGIGTLADQDADDVNITGGTIVGDTLSALNQAGVGTRLVIADGAGVQGTIAESAWMPSVTYEPEIIDPPAPRVAFPTLAVYENLYFRGSSGQAVNGYSSVGVVDYYNTDTDTWTTVSAPEVNHIQNQVDGFQQFGVCLAVLNDKLYVSAKAYTDSVPQFGIPFTEGRVYIYSLPTMAYLGVLPLAAEYTDGLYNKVAQTQYSIAVSQVTGAMFVAVTFPGSPTRILSYIDDAPAGMYVRSGVANEELYSPLHLSPDGNWMLVKLYNYYTSPRLSLGVLAVSGATLTASHTVAGTNIANSDEGFMDVVRWDNDSLGFWYGDGAYPVKHCRFNGTEFQIVTTPDIGVAPCVVPAGNGDLMVASTTSVVRRDPTTGAVLHTVENAPLFNSRDLQRFGNVFIASHGAGGIWVLQDSSAPYLDVNALIEVDTLRATDQAGTGVRLVSADADGAQAALANPATAGSYGAAAKTLTATIDLHGRVTAIATPDISIPSSAISDSTVAGRALVTGADAAAQRTSLALGTIATQAASSVAITGGTIDGAVIGGVTPAAVSATTVAASSTATASNLKRGTGSPEGAVVGSIGDVFQRTDGGSGTALYMKESGSATNTGWIAVAIGSAETIEGSIAADQVAIGSGAGTIKGDASFTAAVSGSGLLYTMDTGPIAANASGVVSRSTSIATTGYFYGVSSELTASPTAPSSVDYRALYGGAVVSVGAVSTATCIVVGVYGKGHVISNALSGALAGKITGVSSAVFAQDTAATAGSSVGVIYGFNVDAAAFTGSASGPLTVGTYCGIYLKTPTLTNAVITNNYGVYQQDPAATNYFAGRISAPLDATISGLTIGKGAGSIATNTAFGVDALDANTTGLRNSAFGNSALLSNTTGVYLTAIGPYALLLNTEGSFNVGVGDSALRSNRTGTDNTAVGVQALFANTSGGNCAFGGNSLVANTSGNSNCAFGYNTLRNNITGSHNVVIGSQAARYFGAGDDNAITVSNSVIIGSDARPAADGETNQIVIGRSAIGAGSNTVTLGHTDITKTVLRGDISLTSAKYVYLRGDETTDGSVRISSQSAGTAKLEARSGGTWSNISFT